MVIVLLYVVSAFRADECRHGEARRARIRPRRHRQGDGEGHRGRKRPHPGLRRRRHRPLGRRHQRELHRPQDLLRRGRRARFPVYSPYIAEIEVIRRGKVRRAKLYYLRGRRGKSARIVERSDARARRLNAQWKGFKKQKGEPDDLTQIKGIDADLVGRLRQLNCIKLEQIANLSDDDIANIDEVLQLGGRIEKDDWVGQAQNLVAEASAAEVPAEEEAKA